MPVAYNAARGLYNARVTAYVARTTSIPAMNAGNRSAHGAFPNAVTDNFASSV